MTVKNMLNLYQSWIDAYSRKRIRLANEGNEPEADAFYAGAITGFNNAYILLQKHEKEGLEPSDSDMCRNRISPEDRKLDLCSK